MKFFHIVSSVGFAVGLNSISELSPTNSPTPDPFVLYRSGQKISGGTSLYGVCGGTYGTQEACEELCVSTETCGYMATSTNNCCLLYEIEGAQFQNNTAYNTYVYSPRTPTPTAAPTMSPTISLPAANEDPHITNVHGKHFQLHKSGRFNMLQIHSEQGEHLVSVKADMEALDEKPCATTFIRRIDVFMDNSTMKIRRGENRFSEVIAEPFEISVNDKSWLSHASFPGNRFVNASGKDECVHDRSHDCQSFTFHNDLLTLNIRAGASPNHKRHFLNMDIAQLHIGSNVASGVLWSDTSEQFVGC